MTKDEVRVAFAATAYQAILNAHLCNTVNSAKAVASSAIETVLPLAGGAGLRADSTEIGC